MGKGRAGAEPAAWRAERLALLVCARPLPRRCANRCLRSHSMLPRLIYRRRVFHAQLFPPLGPVLAGRQLRQPRRSQPGVFVASKRVSLLFAPDLVGAKGRAGRRLNRRVHMLDFACGGGLALAA